MGSNIIVMIFSNKNRFGLDKLAFYVVNNSQPYLVEYANLMHTWRLFV